MRRGLRVGDTGYTDFPRDRRRVFDKTARALQPRRSRANLGRQGAGWTSAGEARSGEAHPEEARPEEARVKDRSGPRDDSL